MCDLETDSSGRESDQFRTPLHIACEIDDSRLLALLLVHNCDKDRKDFTGKTPLWRAAQAGLPQNVQLLLKSGLCFPFLVTET